MTFGQIRNGPPTIRAGIPLPNRTLEASRRNRHVPFRALLKRAHGNVFSSAKASNNDDDADAVVCLPPHQVAPWTRRAPPGRISCEAAVSTADVSSSGAASSSSGVDPDAEAAAKVGARVRVKVPVKVYHVQKLPELELQGLEGQIKQYAGLWKGKRISANLPFKVEFVLPDGVEGRPGPLKFVAHLREDEIEFLPQD
ncbi:hypothetical protein Taro_026194 [Colocasia esculenta]|uniref:Ferredoxin thioredoxin reductase alpha chain domain-containing protein n=1 Tax=Colocasia esculenta TaxID=4460 RepID=A0A843VEJ9_COLES|nr:hypothetical protein [Colocasia esculenta]